MVDTFPPRGISAIQTVSLSFYRFATPGARLWAFSQMLFARFALSRVPGLGFWKLLGSGTGEGFTPVPNTAVYAILGTWPSMDHARRQIADAPVFRRYRGRASESYTIHLGATSARGAWDGRAPFAPDGAEPAGPLAAMTRATLRPRILLQFWRRVPSVSQAIGADPNVAFKIGLGEVPWFHQVTFSVWPNPDAMAAFARRGGPHAQAIRAVREGRWFKEELYARFRILGEDGKWEGESPLAALSKEVLPA